MAKPDDWPSTHRSLIEGLRSEFEGPSWELFVDVYGKLIYKYCRRRGLQDADARDVSQIVFVRVRRGINRFTFDPARGKFRSWLGTITAREIARNQQKSRRTGDTGESVMEAARLVVADEASWIVEFNGHLCQTALERIQSDFEEVTWKAFRLLWIEDKKPHEVANAMGKPVDWVYQLKYRVLKRLEKEVEFLTADIASFTRSGNR